MQLSENAFSPTFVNKECSSRRLPSTNSTAKQLLVWHANRYVRLHHLPLTVFLMKDGGPASGYLFAILQGPYRATRCPADRAFDERLDPSRGGDPDAALPHLLLQGFGCLLRFPPLVRIRADQDDPFLSRGVTVDHGRISSTASLTGVGLEGGEDDVS